MKIVKRIKKSVVSFLIVFSILLTCIGQSSLLVNALSNEETIYNYLTGTMGLNTAAACGVLANIEKESNFRNNVIEYGYTWASGGGYGICQWTNSPRTSSTGRRTNLVNWCQSNGYDYTSLTGQLHFLEHELNTSYYYNLVTSKLKSVSNTADGAYTAGYYWCYYFEVPAGYNTGVSVTRGNYAKDTYWPKYGKPDVILEENTSYKPLLPITAYLNGKSTVYPCERDCSTQTGGQIWSTDKCTINAVYTNGWCQVTYPTASEPKTAYTPLSNFMDSGLSQKTAICSMDTYSRADGETRIGSVSQGDVCYITGTSGAYTQAIYPTASGYKLGWSLSSLWNYTEPSADARFNPYCPIKGYILSGDTNQDVYESTDTSAYAGKIFPGDYCSIKAVYANGWCLVEYPAGSSTKIKYAPLGAFVHDVGCTPQKYIANDQITVHTKADMASTVNWYISNGDTFFVLSRTPATAGQIAQVLYPIDAQYGGGYKIGWIYQSDIPVYTYTVTYL